MGKKKQKIVFIKQTQTNRYKVKRLVNLVEPHVGTYHGQLEVQVWIDMPTVDVEIVS